MRANPKGAFFFQSELSVWGESLEQFHTKTHHFPPHTRFFSSFPSSCLFPFLSDHTMPRSSLLSSLLSLLLVLSSLPSAHSQTCQVYTGTICKSLFTSSVLVKPLAYTVDATEAVLIGQGFGNLTMLGPVVDPICAQAGLNYACALAYPQCVVNSTGSVFLDYLISLFFHSLRFFFAHLPVFFLDCL